MLETGVDLGPHNTLALPATAAHFLSVRTLADLAPLLGAEARRWGRRLILGGGSNVVLVRPFDGLVLHVGLRGRRLLAETPEAWVLEAAAGEPWHDFVGWTLAMGWPGLENLSLIPGTVGAAPIQNIGAYGLEVGELLDSLDATDLDTGLSRTFTQAECRLGYRDSLFKQEGWHLFGRYLITAVRFRLPKTWAPRLNYADLATEVATAAADIRCAQPLEVAAAVIRLRQRRLPDPALLPNVGSFFQNPVVDAAQAAALRADYPAMPFYPQPDGRIKLAAGWLIEQAGWRGRRLGPVGMYEKQALVLVNHGGASGAQVIALARAVQQAVTARFGVALVPEPIVV